MCFFDSPVYRCEMVREMVLTDQTQAECAHEHDCPDARDCPLRAYFAETSGVAESELPARKTDRCDLFGPWPKTVAAPRPASPVWMARKGAREQCLNP